MEPDVTPPSGPEVEAGVPDMHGDGPITMLQFVSGIAATVLTTLGTWGAIILKRKRPKVGAEDAVYEVNRATIEDQRAQLVALRSENDALRQARNEFEGAVTRAHANLEIAQQAAAAALAAAQRNAHDLEALRTKWETAQRYIFMLRAELAKFNIPIPAEPK